MGEFLDLKGASLVGLRGLGRVKIERLCTIVERSLATVPKPKPKPKPGPATGTGAPAARARANHPKSDARKALESWEVPPDFPCELINLPVRIRRYCARRGLDGLDQLLEEWERLGYEGFMAQRALGTNSVRRLDVFVSALELGDHAGASAFLPLDPSGRGLSLGRALSRVSSQISPVTRRLLFRRLVERKTLEESGLEDGLTRERVRQREAEFLGRLRDCLDYFSDDLQRLLATWAAGGDWFESLRPIEPLENEELVAAALESEFWFTPEGEARALGEESRMEAWQEELAANPDLWFGGVRMDDFLAARVPEDEHALFSEHVANSPELRFDRRRGQVHPAKTGVAQTVEAILANESHPIPLTRLVELLVQTGYHPYVTRRTMLRRRPALSRQKGFREHLILWDE